MKHSSSSCQNGEQESCFFFCPVADSCCGKSWFCACAGWVLTRTHLGFSTWMQDPTCTGYLFATVDTVQILHKKSKLRREKENPHYYHDNDFHIEVVRRQASFVNDRLFVDCRGARRCYLRSRVCIFPSLDKIILPSTFVFRISRPPPAISKVFQSVWLRSVQGKLPRAYQ